MVRQLLPVADRSLRQGKAWDPGYIRFNDDILILGASREQLGYWRTAIEERLVGLRLALHSDGGSVHAVGTGLSFLGFRVFPTHRVLLPGRAVRAARRIRPQRELVQPGAISAVEFAHSIRSWVAHATTAIPDRLRPALPGAVPTIRHVSFLPDVPRSAFPLPRSNAPQQAEPGDQRASARRETRRTPKFAYTSTG